MSRKHRRGAPTRDRNNSARHAIRAHEIQPGYIVWLPASAIERGKIIRQFASKNKVQAADTDNVLPSEAYDHPVVVLEIVDLLRRDSNHNIFVIAAMLTSFGYTAGCDGTDRLSTTRREALWGSYLAIHPSNHPSNTDVLYLQHGKLEKPSYVRLARIYVPISALQMFTKGPFATASDTRLTSESLGVLYRELGMKAPGTWVQGLGVGRSRRNTVISSSSSFPVVHTPGTLHAPHSTPYRLQISAREDTFLITNIKRSSQPHPISYTGSNYGSTDTWYLPPPVIWNHRGSTSKISRSSSSICRSIFLCVFTAILCLSLVGLIIFYGPWAFIGSIFAKIGHFFASIWSSCWGYIAHGWTSFVAFLSKSWHIFISWVKSLSGK